MYCFDRKAIQHFSLALERGGMQSYVENVISIAKLCPGLVIQVDIVICVPTTVFGAPWLYFRHCASEHAFKQHAFAFMVLASGKAVDGCTKACDKLGAVHADHSSDSSSKSVSPVI